MEYMFTRKELNTKNASSFKEGDIITIVDKNKDYIYTIDIHYGNYKIPMATTVSDRNYNVLNCTPGTKGGWPYYISNFIYS